MKRDHPFQLYLIADLELCGANYFLDIIHQAVLGGVTAVQIRAKTLSHSEFLSIAKSVKLILNRSSIPLIINDSVEIAKLIEAEGVHLGQSDTPPGKARSILGSEAIIGLSVETQIQLMLAQKFPVDYLALSPIFHTNTKPELTSAWNLTGIQAAKKMSSHPLVAIGGINKTNVRVVILAGADGIAIASAICAHPFPEKAANELRLCVHQALISKGASP